MKIAVTSDDGAQMSRHFGRASYYVVFGIEGGAVVSREVRSKVFHHGTSHEHHDGQKAEAGHGHLPVLQEDDLHGRMASSIDDCQVVLAGGMGAGAYNSLVGRGLTPAFVDSDTVDDAVADYLAGRTIDHPLCRH